MHQSQTSLDFCGQQTVHLLTICPVYVTQIETLLNRASDKNTQNKKSVPISGMDLWAILAKFWPSQRVKT